MKHNEKCFKLDGKTYIFLCEFQGTIFSVLFSATNVNSDTTVAPVCICSDHVDLPFLMATVLPLIRDASTGRVIFFWFNDL